MHFRIQFAICLNIALLAIPAGPAVAKAGKPAATSAPAVASPANSALCSPDNFNAGQLRPGDRITITMYERVEPNDNDRNPSRSEFPNYRLRPEVSGDFNIGEDGAISIPILGPFKAAGQSSAELHDALAHAFESTLGHVGIITIALVERQPIYIDGVVKNPGAYRYTPGLTVFHALSLAGGYQDIKLESHQILLATAQDAVNGEEAKSNLMRLLAREAVLRAELDSTEVTIPRQLLDLVDEKQARALINAQIGERKTVGETDDVLERQQVQVIDSAKRALDVKNDEMKLVDDAIDARTRRLKTMESMTSKGLVGDPLLQAAKAEYLDTLARKQELIAATQLNQTQITDAQSKMAKLKLDTRYALQHELTQLELQIQQQSAVYRAHLAVASMINDDPNFSPGGAPLEFDLIRRIGDRIETRRVQGACLLQPGDLVRIRLASPDPGKN